jgi:predicted alpha-1,2-mannosidase
MSLLRAHWRAPALLAATALVLALPTAGQLPTAAAAPGDVAFSSSFETGQPAVTWVSTPEGTKSSGVTGPAQAGIPGDITATNTGVSANAENPPNETAAKAVDGDENSKWLAFTSTGWLRVNFASGVTVKRYALTSANDFPERDPRDWQVQGSNDNGATWTTIDSKTGQSFDQRFQTKVFDIPTNTTAYAAYRLNITANLSGGIIQLAEFRLSDGSAAVPPSGPMVAEVGNGPTSAYNAKTGVGFTGLKALRYAGQVTGAGGGKAWDKVYDVDIPVGAKTELSYRIFPELTKGDLRYPSTYASVDLAFTDGSYLSDLAAVDQLGFGLSPRAQGDSKALYANQWNPRSSLVGAVATGKTIDRILVGYDNPTGPVDFGGWVDDLVVREAPPVVVGRPSDHVVTTRGTQSNSSFSRGNNFPATAVPNGFNFWTPVTDAGSTSWLYEYHRDNDANNRTRIEAFSTSHEPSPWMNDRNTFQLMPSTAAGLPNASRSARALPFGHENEVARAHYYGVTFDNGLKAEIAPTDHAAAMRFTYPGANANVIFDNVNNSGGLSIDPATRSFSGYSDVRAGQDGATRMFVYGTLDAPVTASGALSGGGGSNVTRYVKVDAGASKTVTVRLATSLISLDQAKKNLAMEIPDGRTFDHVRDAAQDAWDQLLGRVEVEGATADQLTTLYSNLYRLYLYPNSAFENTGTTAAPKYQYASPVQPAAASTPTQTGAKIVDGKIYVNNGFWATYRTTWPAYSLLTPNKAAEMVDGFAQQYRDGGWIARWSSPGYANLMTGTSSDVAFADAYTKGVPLKDVQATYGAAVRNATVTPPGNPNNSSVGRKGLQQSVFLGFTPTTVGEGVSWALEGYINDFGIAKMAEKLSGDAMLDGPTRDRYRAEAAYFLNRAQNYVKMFDPKVGFFQGFDPQHVPSKTPAEYNPLDWGGDYTETDGWNFAFHAPQDGQGLANLYGGRDGLANKLDQFFATPEDAMHPGGYGGVIHEMLEARDVRMGQLGMSNQVSHHIPYMYDYAGQPAKTAEKVREIMSRLYSGSEIGQGYAGDEDNGETSAWWLFSAMGFYPLQMGDGHYAVGSPLFTKMTLHLDNGKTLTVNAPNNSAKNIYVTGLSVNGVARDQAWIDHQDIANGGTVTFTMGSAPTSWGKATQLPSITSGDQPPTPLDDLTGSGQGQASGVGSAGALTDNTSLTETTLPTGQAVTYRFVAPKNAVGQYTLTSGNGGGTPTAWRLEASNDGQKWKEVDARSNETFDWRLQTRPFNVKSPGQYQYYRLTMTATSGGNASLAELELIGRPGRLLTDQEYVDSYVKGLDLGDTSAVTANLSLPTGDGTTTVTWKSSDTSWLTDSGLLVLRPDVGQQPVTVQLTVTVTKGTATATRMFAVTIAPWTAADMTYPAGTDLSTSFQDGQPQPLSNARLISSHIGEFCCGIGGMETTRGSVDQIPQHDGNAALLFSGEAIDPEPSAASSAVLPASGIWVKPGAHLSYWVYPEAGTGRVSTYVAMDVLFTDGTYLHDLAAPASNGGTSAPVSQGTLLQTNTWQEVTLDVGAVAAGKQMQAVVFSFGSGDLNGQYRGFVDSVALTHPASS